MADKVHITSTEVLYDDKHPLKRIHFDYKKKDGKTEEQSRVVYDHGNAVTVFLYNKEHRTIILTRQLRIASYLNGNTSGMLLETCAGLLERESPEEAIKREIREETGYEINTVNKIMQLYMSPGAYTELLHFYTAEYKSEQKTGKGGGLEEEEEEVEVLEIAFDEAFRMINKGEIKDAKTVILLLYAKANGLL